jgi:hypothetical protein
LVLDQLIEGQIEAVRAKRRPRLTECVRLRLQDLDIDRERLCAPMQPEEEMNSNDDQ